MNSTQSICTHAYLVESELAVCQQMAESQRSALNDALFDAVVHRDLHKAAEVIGKNADVNVVTKFGVRI